MFVFSGGIAKQTYVSSNGTMIICANGKAFNTNVVSGKLKIEDGGSAERAKVSGGGIMTVEDGGSAKDAEVGSGGRLIVSGGAQADNITVTEGIMYVMNDAVANYTIVNDGASMFVENNGKVLIDKKQKYL